MKLSRLFTASALAATLSLGGAVFAQGPPDGPGGRGFRAGGPGPFAGLALRELNLTDAQQQQVRAIREQHRDELRDAETQLRAAMTAQRKAIETVPVNEDLIRSTTATLAEAQTAAAIIEARVYSETWAILNSSQQAQLKKIEAQRQARAQEFRQRGRQQQPN